MKNLLFHSALRNYADGHKVMAYTRIVLGSACFVVAGYQLAQAQRNR